MSSTNNAIGLSQQGVAYYNGIGVFSGLDGSTIGKVLTSNGTGVAPSFQAASSGGITTIDGNTGSVTGSTITLETAHTNVIFNGSTTIMTQDFGGDTNSNLFIGSAFPNLTTGSANTFFGSRFLAIDYQLADGSANTILGYSAGYQITSGNSNTILGQAAANALLTGQNNTIIGSSTGEAYTSSESANVLLNSLGVVGESNVLRIGASTGSSGQSLNKAFISGIQNSAVTGMQAIGVNSSDQIGTGIINNSSQPAFRAFLSSPSGNLTGDSTPVTVPFDTVDYDQTSSYNNSTNVYTLPVTGKYQFNSTVFAGQTTGVNTVAIFAFGVNASVLAERVFELNFANCNASGELVLTASFNYNGTAGDTIYVTWDVGGNATKNIFFNLGTAFSGFLIC